MTQSMGKSEDNISVKTEKGSPSRQEPNNSHLCPDWRNIQAYYGPGVPLPPSFPNSPVTTGQVHHPHVWPPTQLTHLVSQQLMPPYGLPYSTIYSQGVIYTHPAVPFVATPLSMTLHSKSSESHGSVKKLRRLDKLAVSIGNNRTEVDAEGSIHEESLSVGIGASSDGSDGNTRAHQSQRSNSMSTPLDEHDDKVHAHASILQVGETNGTNSMGSINGKAETHAACVTTGMPFEVYVQERQLKRERRKQANRESARRSRLRKQAEIEKLMKTYESLKVENLILKSEISQLTMDSEKVRLENAALMEKLNAAQPGEPLELVPYETGSNMTLPYGDD